MKSELQQVQHMEVLSRLVIGGQIEGDETAKRDEMEKLRRELSYVAKLGEDEFASFAALAWTHHVIVRALDVVRRLAALEPRNVLPVPENERRVAERCERAMVEERSRIDRAVGYFHSICGALEERGCPVAVIKSLDHWPDLGSDLDLYTTASPDAVDHVMRGTFRAERVDRSWGDRLANKWNYSVPGLPELVEIHVQYLGQTGEHSELARRVIERRVEKKVGQYDFLVAAPEERIVISALQRVYRHFYFRLCDMIDTATLLKSGRLHFGELEQAANSAGIWEGVSTYLCLVENYVRLYGGVMTLPAHVKESALSPEAMVQFKGGYLRVSMTTGARLYSSQLLAAGKHGDMRALLRLPLLPPLAISALVAHSLTGNDKGIW